jgi:hypothetical protein
MTQKDVTASVVLFVCFFKFDTPLGSADSLICNVWRELKKVPQSFFFSQRFDNLASLRLEPTSFLEFPAVRTLPAAGWRSLV